MCPVAEMVGFRPALRETPQARPVRAHEVDLLIHAATGRDRILKVEGCYHGHHDSVMVSVYPYADDLGPADAPTAFPDNTGIPAAITGLVTVVPLIALFLVLQRYWRGGLLVGGVTG